MQHRFLQALNCCNEKGPPVWLMRQAGRHLASYRKIREKHSFLSMCHDSQLIAEITHLPIQSYGMDAAILFSDILVVAEAMGSPLSFQDKVGPVFDRPIHHRKDVDQLLTPNIEKLRYVADGIGLFKKSCSTPLIGFCGAPFTVASYMIEGRSSKDLKKTKQWMYNDPIGFHLLLQKILDWSIAYVKMQVEAGVDAIQVFDSWANFLDQESFKVFSLYYLKKIVDALRSNKVPVILYCRGSSVFAPLLVSVKPSTIGLDWNCDMGKMRKQVPKSIALQGNLDPDLLYAPLQVIEERVNALLDKMKGDKGFVVNLGHGVLPDVSEEAVATLVQTVKRRQ